MEKNRNLPGITIEGEVKVAGDMFNIHDNEHVHINIKQMPQMVDDDYEYVDLCFFEEKYFGTIESQHKLRRVLRAVLPRIDTDSGRDWVVVYIAYHYYIGREFIMKGYSDFFTDIEGLLPDVLTKVNKDEKGGDKRYKTYTDLLRLECPNWFIIDECLPPMNEWTSKRFDYKVDDNRRNRIQKLVREIYQGLKHQ